MRSSSTVLQSSSAAKILEATVGPWKPPVITHLPKIEFAPFEVADTTYKVTSKSNFFVDILANRTALAFW